MTLSLLKYRSTIIWAALVVLTIISWQVGTHGSDHERATVIVLALAFIKIRLIGLDFMELRDAPIGLRLSFEIYVIAIGALLIAMYLTT